MPRYPLVAAAAFFAAGTLLAPAGAGSLPWIPLLAALLAFAAGLAHLASPDAPVRRALRPAAIWIVPAGFLPLGLVAASAGSPAPRGAALEAWLAARGGAMEEPADLSGRLIDDPIPRTPPGEGCDLTIEVDEAPVGGHAPRPGGVARVAMPPPPEGVEDPCLWRQGARVRVSARLRLARSLGNPGALDYRGFLRARGIDALGVSTSARLANRTHPPGPFDAAVGIARHLAVGALSRAFAKARSEEGAGFAKAILLGRREDLPPASVRALQKAGTSHLLAISGFHVGILAAALWLAARLLGGGWRARWLAPSLALPAYLSITSGAPSAARAVAGACAHAAGRLLGRSPAPLNTIAGVFLLFSAARPDLVHDAGFQMSFVAAGALAAFARRPARAGLFAWLAGGLRTSLLALSATAPLVALHFNRVTPGGLPANLAAGPLMAAGLTASALSIPLELLLGTPAGPSPVDPIAAGLARASEICARIASGSFAAIAAMSEAIARVPGASFRCATPPPGVAAFALAAGAAGALDGIAPRRRRLLLSAALAGIVWISLPIERRPADPGALRITVFDVGQGSSALVETPGGRRVLVDGGGWSRTPFDVGERVVARALMSMGILRLDAIAVSHGDFDHAGGIPSLIENFDGEEIWIAEPSREDPAVRRAASAALDRGRVLRLLARGAEFGFGGARVRALHPPAREPSLSRNDRSLVVEIEAAAGRVLLPGDAEKPSERMMAPHVAPVGLLIVPHHGSRGASSAAFLAAARPLVAVVSCGYANSYGHPHAEALGRLAATGAAILRTDRDGAVQVTLRSGPPRARVLRFANGSFREAGNRRRRSDAGDPLEGGGDERQNEDGRPDRGHGETRR